MAAKATQTIDAGIPGGQGQVPDHTGPCEPQKGLMDSDLGFGFLFCFAEMQLGSHWKAATIRELYLLKTAA